MADASAKLLLYPDDSYEGPTVPEFDASRGEGVMAFFKAVGVAAPAAREAQPRDNQDSQVLSSATRSQGDLWATWQTAVSSSDGRPPEDFGFLFNGGGQRSRAMEEGFSVAGGNRSRSRSRSPSRSRDGEDWKVDKKRAKKGQQQRLDAITSRPVGNCSRGKAGTTLICKFWLRGACSREDCKFLHCEPEEDLPGSEESCQRRSPSQSSGNSRREVVRPVGEERLEGIQEDEEVVDVPAQPPRNKAVMCKFALKGCPRSNCSFAHSEQERREACRNMPCHFDARGKCRQGANCWYRHTSTAPNTPPLADAVSGPDGLVNQSEPTPLKSLIVRRQRAGTKEDEPSSATSQSAQQDKTLLCKFWLRNVCQRTTNCKFAHGEEEQLAACGKVPCRFFSETGRCRQGDDCWYLHDGKVGAEKAALQDVAAMETETAMPGAAAAMDMDQPASNGAARSFQSSASRSERWADLEDSNEGAAIVTKPRWADLEDSNSNEAARF